VGRFQRGEEVEFEAPAEEVKKAVVVTKPPAPVPEKVPTKPITTARVPKSQPMKATAKKFAPAKTAPKPKAQPEGAVSKLASLSSSSSTAKQKSAQATPDKSTAADTNKPQPAQKGKPKIECGCFGNLHKALANCLHCGRVSCQKEGYDFCPFCTNLVLPVVPPEEGMYVQRNKPLISHLYIIPLRFAFLNSHCCFCLFFSFERNEAWARKERLLQYERESAERTVVLDDQADHFSSQDSAWLTEDERADAKERSDARSHEMSHRKKVQLSINI
jgi:hypothetical protein